MLEAIKAASRPVNLIYRAALDNKAPTAVRASISNFVSELKARSPFWLLALTCLGKICLSWFALVLSLSWHVSQSVLLIRLKNRRFYRRRGAQRSRCGCSSSSTGADKSFLLSNSFKLISPGTFSSLISGPFNMTLSNANRSGCISIFIGLFS